MPYAELTPDIACNVIGKVGISITPRSVCVEAREARWVMDLPGDRVAWFAASDVGGRRLATERRVLRLLADRCSFAVPRVLFEDPAGDFEIRSKVPGICGSARIFSGTQNRELIRRAGAAIGLILAEQHTNISVADIDDWLPKRPSLPETREWIIDRLAAVVNDAKFIRDARRVMDAYTTTPTVE